MSINKIKGNKAIPGDRGSVKFTEKTAFDLTEIINGQLFQQHNEKNSTSYITKSGYTLEGNLVFEIKNPPNCNEYHQSYSGSMTVFIDLNGKLLSMQDGEIWFEPADKDAVPTRFDINYIDEKIRSSYSEAHPYLENRSDYVATIKSYLKDLNEHDDQNRSDSDVRYDHGIISFDKTTGVVQMYNNGESILTNQDLDLLNQDEFLRSTPHWYANSKYFDPKNILDMHDIQKISYLFDLYGGYTYGLQGMGVQYDKGFSYLLQLRNEGVKQISISQISLLSRSFIEKYEDEIIKLIGELNEDPTGINITNRRKILKDMSIIKAPYKLTKHLLEKCATCVDGDQLVRNFIFYNYNTSNGINEIKDLLRAYCFNYNILWDNDNSGFGDKNKRVMGILSTFISRGLHKDHRCYDEMRMFYKNGTRVKTGPMLVEKLLSEKEVELAKKLIDDGEGESQKDFYKKMREEYEKDKNFKTIYSYGDN